MIIVFYEYYIYSIYGVVVYVDYDI